MCDVRDCKYAMEIKNWPQSNTHCFEKYRRTLFVVILLLFSWVQMFFVKSRFILPLHEGGG